MPSPRLSRVIPSIALVVSSVAFAADHDPIQLRQQAMEKVGDAAKPIGQMLKQEREFDADLLQASLETMLDVSGKFGDLFPSGSESGEGTEAAPAIWEDREGFEQVLADWQTAVSQALEANPDSLEATKPAVGPVFKQCKACHDSYRIKDE